MNEVLRRMNEVLRGQNRSVCWMGRDMGVEGE